MQVDFYKFAMDDLFIEEEYRRIDAQPIQGDLPNMIQSEMGRWAKESGIWTRPIHYRHIVDAHAEMRGWTQEGFTGLEMPHATDS